MLHWQRSPQVRADLGYPPLVTPLSQMVGNQAVTNVLVGERYQARSPRRSRTTSRANTASRPAPISEELQKKILGEGGKPVDCRIEDAEAHRTRNSKMPRKALGDLARIGRRYHELYLLSGSDHEIPGSPQGTRRRTSQAVYTIEAM